MLKKLRLKFILLNMVTVTVVLTAVFGTVCYLDWSGARRDVVEQLTAQAERAQQFVGLLPGGSYGYYDPFGGSGRGPRGREIGPDGDSPSFPVAVYILSATDGTYSSDNLIMVEMLSSAMVSEDITDELAQVVATMEDGFARLDGMDLYCARTSFDGVVTVALAETSTTDGWKDLAWIFALVGLGTLAVFLIISLFFSRWALKPVAEAWDREHRFVADVSHDLKTPLAVILANNAILRDNPDATVTEMGQWVESTETEALEMNTLVNDMLELARFDAADAGQAQVGAKAANATALDFSTIVEEQALMFESVAYDRGVELASAVEPGCSVLGQAQAVSRLVSSLIDNACKYTPAGGRITVTLAKAPDGKSCAFAVNNTGAVISPEDLPHLFDRFYRTDAARTAGDGGDGTATGHGLGLAIAKGIAESHGGTLAAESDAVHGTTFTARLPLL